MKRKMGVFNLVGFLFLLVGLVVALALIKSPAIFLSNAKSSRLDPPSQNDGLAITTDMGLCVGGSSQCLKQNSTALGRKVTLEVEIYNLSPSDTQLEVKVPIFDFAPDLTYVSGSSTGGAVGVWSRSGNDMVWSGYIVCHSPQPGCANGYEAEYVRMDFTANAQGEYELSASFLEDSQWSWSEGPVKLTVASFQADLYVETKKLDILMPGTDVYVSTKVGNNGPDQATSDIKWEFDGTVTPVPQGTPCTGSYSVTGTTVTWNAALGCTLESGDAEEHLIKVVRGNNRSFSVKTSVDSKYPTSFDYDLSNNISFVKVR